MSSHFLQPCLRRGHTAWRLENETSGAVLAARLIPAFDRQTRNQGLLGRASLPSDVALALAPCSGVHTWFMRFPIDILFVSRTGEVLKIRRAVGPRRFALRLGAFAVVEMAAMAAGDVRLGHKLTVTVVS